VPLLIAWLLIAPAAAWAHTQEGAASSDSEALVERLVLVLVITAAVAYLPGVLNRWRAAPTRSVVVRDGGAFALATVAMLTALADPLERWISRAFFAHMIQHEILMVIAAPLYVLGRPLATWAWALPDGMRRKVHPLRGRRALLAAWRAFTSPWGASFVQIAVLVIWHVPRFFDAAVREPWVHAAQHSSFLVVALAFWWAVVRHAQRGQAGRAVAACFVTMIATGALGALLTFAPQPWYASYSHPGGLANLTALEDQQLGGLVMWIPAGVVYAIAALWRASAWVIPRHPARHDRVVA
jgi:putative membrane protein